MANFDALGALPPVVFPLSSGPPVCVAVTAAWLPFCFIPMLGERRRANFVGYGKNVRPKTMAEKFCLEPSLEHEGLVHVRNCVDRKYWVPLTWETGRGSHSHSPWFIGCTADEPEEDLDKPSCTLFEFRPLGEQQYGATTVRIFHPQLKKYAAVSGRNFGGTFLQLVDDQEVKSTLYAIRVRRLSLQKELPKYIALKGGNGKYLSPKPQAPQEEPYLQFCSSEVTDPAVVHETSTDEYGVVRIRSMSSGKFWRLRENAWICADSNDAPYNDAGTAFRLVITDDNNCISLQNISNGKFCRSLCNNQGEELWLSASADDSSAVHATLLFEEAVRSRHVYDVQYRVGGEKTSTNEGISRNEVCAANRTKETHNAKQKIILYERNEKSWNLDVTANAGIKAHLTASLPLWILKLEGGVEAHLDIEGKLNWGETNVKESQKEANPSFPVPPMTKVTCSVFTRETVVDVPFSYKRRDVLYNGEVLPPRELHDGIYRGITTADIHVSSKDEPLK